MSPKILLLLIHILLEFYLKNTWKNTVDHIQWFIGKYKIVFIDMFLIYQIYKCYLLLISYILQQTKDLKL